MRIQNNISYPNYASQRQNPNFTSIKKVSYSGFYKDFPMEGQKLFETLQQNPCVMSFCEKYDVKILFSAAKNYAENIESSIHIVYDNPALGKLKKFFKGLKSSKDEITVHSVKQDLNASTAGLREMILPETEELGMSGLLNTRIKTADEKIQKILEEM